MNERERTRRDGIDLVPNGRRQDRRNTVGPVNANRKSDLVPSASSRGLPSSVRKQTRAFGVPCSPGRPPFMERGLSVFCELRSCDIFCLTTLALRTTPARPGGGTQLVDMGGDSAGGRLTNSEELQLGQSKAQKQLCCEGKATSEKQALYALSTQIALNRRPLARLAHFEVMPSRIASGKASGEAQCARRAEQQGHAEHISMSEREQEEMASILRQTAGGKIAATQWDQ